MSRFETINQDLRYALRGISRSPGLALATIVTLTLGLGLNVSVFTVLDGLLFRARVEKDPESFIHLSPEYRSRSGQLENAWAVSVRDYNAFAADAKSVSELAAWDTVRASMDSADGDTLLTLLVTCNFFRVYGLNSPSAGRLFSPDECAPGGSARVAIISDEFRRARLSGEANPIGRTLRLNRIAFTIVGVMPPGFPGRVRGPGIWLPWSAQPLLFNGRDLFRDNDSRWLTVEGRLRPGVSRREAQSELGVIAARQDSLEPGRQTSMTLTNGSFAEEPALRSSLFWIGPLVMAALTLILLIACTNVTVLQLSRAVTRRREVGIRLSLGAQRGRLVRMLLTEILLLACVAGALSAWVALQAPALFAKMLAGSSTPVYQTRPDLPVFAYLCLAAFASACIAGLSPAAESLRVNLLGSLKAGEAGAGTGANRRHGFLVATQVALSLVLLTAAALFLRAQYLMLHADTGFETRQVLEVVMRQGASSPEAILSRVARTPRVRSVCMGSPFSQGELGPATESIRVSGEVVGAGKQAAVGLVSPACFDTLRIGLVRGRTLSKNGEAVVSLNFARVFWPEKDPIGESVVLADGTAAEVVGIARDVEAEHPGIPDGPKLYRWQNPAQPVDALYVRFEGDAASAALAVREAIRQFDPEATGVPKTLRASMDESAERMSAMVRMVGVLGTLALVLAALGIYGVVSFSVSRRTKELGIRMALGATKELIVRAVLVSGARPIAWGLFAGLLLAFAAAQAVAIVMRRSPVAIDARDPFIFFFVALLLAGVAVAAMFRPALRAAGSDPMKALREE